MDRRSLGFVAILLIVMMAVVASAGLDNLPRDLRKSVQTAATELNTERANFQRDSGFVERTLNDEPALFRDKADAWRERLRADSSRLTTAAASLSAVQQLAKANHRTDAEKVRQQLADFERVREEPARDAAALRSDAERWLRYKRELPARLAAMSAVHEQLAFFDVDGAAAQARKAMTDWPDKKADLENRLEALKELQKTGEQTWAATEPIRTAAERKDEANIDYAALFSAADRLEATAKQVSDGANALNTLAGQLYASWDKVLLDTDEEDGYRRRVRLVSTHYADATLSNGQTSSGERWETIDSGAYREAERSVGMVIERKPAGKYDSEAERVVQPPAFAYMAPPGQSNAYGSWTNGSWQWLPQYLLLSQLLHASRGPVTSGDYEAYDRARRRGEVFWGRNNEYRLPMRSREMPRRDWRPGGGLRGAMERTRDWERSRSYSGSTPSTGGWWKERPKSWGDQSFGGSRYQSRGGFSGSRYQSRGTFSAPGGFGARSYSRGMGGAVRAFGRGGRR